MSFLSPCLFATVTGGSTYTLAFSMPSVARFSGTTGALASNNQK